MDCFLDIFDVSLNKTGEELCGDQVKVHRTDTKTIIVLSDGLGSGVKANILATLTSEIIVTMLKADVSLNEVLATVIGTLPICKIRDIAYATFTIIEIDPRSYQFKVMNFDNPRSFFFRKGRVVRLETTTEQIQDREISIAGGTLQMGDFLGVVSDGVLHAGLGTTWNFGWGWDNVAQHIERVFAQRASGAEQVVRSVMTKTRALYGGVVGDDATFVGVYARPRHSLIVFTGPPLNESDDEGIVERVLQFDGRKVVCGGTTATITATFLGEKLDTELNTLREEVPPIAYLSQIDLVTEGIITMSKALDYMRASGGSARLPRDRNGAVLLAKELLDADSIFFLVGQQINEFYQNPLLPRHLSIRKNLVEEMAQFLRNQKKEVKIEYC